MTTFPESVKARLEYVQFARYGVDLEFNEKREPLKKAIDMAISTASGKNIPWTRHGPMLNLLQKNGSHYLNSIEIDGISVSIDDFRRFINTPDPYLRQVMEFELVCEGYESDAYPYDVNRFNLCYPCVITIDHLRRERFVIETHINPNDILNELDRLEASIDFENVDILEEKIFTPNTRKTHAPKSHPFFCLVIQEDPPNKRVWNLLCERADVWTRVHNITFPSYADIIRKYPFEMAYWRKREELFSVMLDDVIGDLGDGKVAKSVKL